MWQSDKEMLDYLENEWTPADEQFDDLLHDYLDMVTYFPLDDELVVAYRRELESRGCLFVYTPGEGQHLATYRVHYPGDRPTWETALETDMPKDLDYLTGDLLNELLSCEPSIDQVEIVIHEWDGKQRFWYNMELPVKIKVLIAEVER